MSTVIIRKAGRREWIGLAVIALPCLLYSMDLTVLNLALPSLAADLKPTSTQLLWIVDIYGFLVAGSLVTITAMTSAILVICIAILVHVLLRHVRPGAEQEASSH